MEHQSKKHEVESAKQATRVAQEGLEQELQSTQLRLAQATIGLSIGDGLAPLRSPDFQAAQRSQYALSLQKRHGNRYVQRAILGRSAGNSERESSTADAEERATVDSRDVAVAPRADLMGTVARWPEDPEAQLELIAQARAALGRRIRGALNGALRILGSPEPDLERALRSLTHVQERLEEASAVELSDWALYNIARALEATRRATAALESVLGSGENIPQLVHLAWVRARYAGRAFEGARRTTWNNQVYGPLRRARQLARVQGERKPPNWAPVLRIVQTVGRNAAAFTTRNIDENMARIDAATAIESAESAMRVSVRPGGRAAYIRGFASDALLRFQDLMWELDALERIAAGEAATPGEAREQQEAEEAAEAAAE